MSRRNYTMADYRAAREERLGLSTGFGFPMRAVTIYEREQDELFPEGAGG